MSLGGGGGNLNNGQQQESRPNFNSSRQQDPMANQNSQSFSSEKEDLNRQFNRPLDRSDRSSDGWARYESQERGQGMGQGGGPGYDNSKYGSSRPPPSSSSTSSRPGEHGRGGQMGGGNMGGMSSEGFMGRQGSSSGDLKGMGNGRMREGGGNVGMAQGYRSSGVPTSMGGSSIGAPIMGGSSSGAPIMGGGGSGAPIISEGRRGAMGASGGMPTMDRGVVGSFYTSESPTSTSQGWIGEQRRGGSNTTMANNLASQASYQASHPPPGAPLASYPPPGIPPGNFLPPTSRTGPPPAGFNAGGSSSAGFNTANGSFNRPAGGDGGAGGYDSSKYGRARNKPS